MNATPALIPFPPQRPNPEPYTRKMAITPALAREWLKRNKANRPIERVTIEKYKADMLEGRWLFTGDGFGFDWNGDLRNGQHRLIAISECPESFSIAMNVTFDLDPESIFFMDQGRKRTSGQQLAIAGVKNYNHIAAGAKYYLVWVSGILFRDSKQAQLITAPHIQEWVQVNRDLVDAANEIHRYLIRNDATPAVMHAAFFRFFRIEPTAAVTFVTRISDGAGLIRGNPILALRQRLETDRRAGRRRPPRDELGMVIKAWNYWRAQKSLLSITPSDWTEESFPTPK